MFKVPEKFRLTNHPILASNSLNGNNGAFKIPLDNNVIAFVIASDGEGWEHVSVHVIEKGKPETPTWEEMCEVKDLFWSKEDCVMQLHPPESEYVNNHPHCLHLWRPVNRSIPAPPAIMVGYKSLNLNR
jgi:hypothetical protein